MRNPATQSKGSVVSDLALHEERQLTRLISIFKTKKPSRAISRRKRKKSRRSCCLKQFALCRKKEKSYHAGNYFEGMTDDWKELFKIRRAARYSTGDGQASLNLGSEIFEEHADEWDKRRNNLTSRTLPLFLSCHCGSDKGRPRRYENCLTAL